MDNKIIASRMDNIKSDIRGPIFHMALDMEKKGDKILKLNTGNPAAFGFPMPESIKTQILNNVDKSLGYCDLRGMKPAKEAILEYETSKGIPNLTIDDVFITNGVSEAASMIATAILNVDDEILIACPFYSLWTNSAYAANAKPVFYKCNEDDNWNPDIEDIKSKITPKTKAIVVINPNNPTGALYPDRILLEIAEIARQNNLVVISDEIYDRLVFDGLKHNSFAKLSPDVTVITVNGLSKSHCACGLRCGWIVISGEGKAKEDINTALVALASVRLCSNALMQLIIPAALKDSYYTEEMISKTGRLYLQREAAYQAINEVDGLSVVKNMGALYMFPKIDTERFNVTSDKEFVKGLLLAKKILIVAGTGFGYTSPDHFRIVLLPKHEDIKNAIYDIGDYLQTLKK